MKKTQSKAAFAWVGIILSIILIFGMTACEPAVSNKGNPDLAGAISIDPAEGAVTGDKLTARYAGMETGIQYQWYKDGVIITNVNTNTFTPQEAGTYTVIVSADGYNAKTSAAVEVTVLEFVDFAGTLTINPNTNVTTGMILSAAYEGSENVTITYQWYKDGVVITNANNNTFTPEEAGTYKVTISAYGYNPKSATVTVNLATLTGTLSITSETDFTIDEELSADYAGTETFNTVTYQWYKDNNPISGANAQTFTPTVPGTYKVSMTPKGYNIKASGDITVTYKQLSAAKWEEILANIDLFLTGDGVLDLSKYIAGTDVTDTLNDAGLFSIVISSEQQTNANKIKTFILPDAAITLADGAKFNSLTYLAEVEGRFVTTIGEDAFRGCSLLTRASFPELITIEEWGMGRCENLQTVDFPKLESVGPWGFNGAGFIDVTFPSLKNIYSSAFMYCRSLVSINLPEVTTGMSDLVFYGCNKLEHAALPKIINIENQNFEDCVKLKTLTLGAAAPTLSGASIFNNCSQTITVKVPAGATGYDEAWAAQLKGIQDVTIVIEEM